MTKCLLEKGADPNVQNADLATPLHTALSATKVSTRIVEVLISHGASLRIKDGDSKTALHLATTLESA